SNTNLVLLGGNLTSGTSNFVVNEGGLVGIGTDSPSSASESKMRVQYTYTANPSNSQRMIWADATANGPVGGFTTLSSIYTHVKNGITGAGGKIAYGVESMAETVAEGNQQNAVAYFADVMVAEPGDYGFGLRVQDDGGSGGGTMYGVYLD